jgi:membrane glycosyltransferase
MDPWVISFSANMLLGLSHQVAAVMNSASFRKNRCLHESWHLAEISSVARILLFLLIVVYGPFKWHSSKIILACYTFAHSLGTLNIYLSVGTGYLWSCLYVGLLVESFVAVIVWMLVVCCIGFHYTRQIHNFFRPLRFIFYT